MSRARAPEPSSVLICEKCKQDWYTHCRRAENAARSEFHVEWPTPVQVQEMLTFEICVELLKEKDRGPMGPQGPTGPSGGK